VPLPGGVPLGLDVRESAYPLAVCDATRAGRLPLPPWTLRVGSYLVVVRADGMEPLRLPAVVEHDGRSQVAARMPRPGASPPEFVGVAGGLCKLGGDLAGHEPKPLRVGDVEGFWIARHEVTFEEYVPFLDDSETRAEIEEARTRGRTIRVPRDPRGP